MITYGELSKICKEVLFKEPFYGLYLMTLEKRITTAVPTAAVSSHKLSYELLINPKFFGSLSEKHRIGIIKHELLHCVFFHLMVRSDFSDKIIFNIAADMEINQYIDDDYLPEGGVRLDSFPEINLPPKAGTKFYYDALKQAKESGSSPTLDDLCNAIENQQPQSSDGINNPNHDTWKNAEDLSETEKSLIKAQTKHVLEDIANAVKLRGSVPSEIEELLKNLNYTEPPKFDWRGYVRRFVGRSVKVYTKKLKRKPNKRYDENPGIKIKVRKHILVAVDTSGSVNREELKEFFQEIDHLSRTGNDITVVQADAAISDIRPYTKKMEIEIHGRGGTSFDPVVDYYVANKNKYSCLIYFTDGEASAPENTKQKILWVLSSRSKMNNFLPGDVIKLN